MKKLVIDTTDNTKTIVQLLSDNKTDELKSERKTKSQETLILIEKIIKKNHINLNEIDEIVVNTGPGSFTGTRVGVAIANALGFGLDIKVNGSKDKQALPEYS
jgi:tRNA threonylcarbamoyladenosine biosynthesis protein TsaB